MSRLGGVPFPGAFVVSVLHPCLLVCMLKTASGPSLAIPGHLDIVSGTLATAICEADAPCSGKTA